MALAMVLVVAGAILPLWGFTVDTSRIPYTSGEGVDFGLWVGEKWDSALLPGSVFRRATALLWWDFVVEFPEFSRYGDAVPPLLILWAGTLGLTLYALYFRRTSLPRMGGWPTRAQAAALILLLTALVLSAYLLPAVADLGSFFGVEGRMSWGPKIGWFAGLLALSLLVLSTWIGWSTDRRLKGRCWHCDREVSGDVCEYCGKHQ